MSINTILATVLNGLSDMDIYLRTTVDTARGSVGTWLDVACTKIADDSGGVCQDGDYVHRCIAMAFAAAPILIWLWMAVMASLLLVIIAFLGGMAIRTLAVVWLRMLVSVCIIFQSGNELSLFCLRKALDSVRWGKK